MVLAHLVDLASSNQIEAAVSHPGRPCERWIDRKRHTGGPHAMQMFFMQRETIDLLVCGFDGELQGDVCRIFGVREVRSRDLMHGHRARDASAASAAHAVGENRKRARFSWRI